MVAVVGPESSGKSTLCAALAKHYEEPWVEEHARYYLEQLGRPYQESDLLRIAEGQIRREHEALQGAHRLLICDTDMITIRIWSEEKFGRCDPRLVRLTEERHYDLWLLCRPDIPWESDPLRENPHDRDRLFQRYLQMLRRSSKPFIVIEGEREERIQRALMALAPFR